MSLAFTTTEIDLLGRTADALCAYLGKPVVAEIVTEPEEGFEWVLFAIPLDPTDEDEAIAHVQVGGPGARVLGSQGGLNFSSGQALDCQFLWAIQRSEQEDSRYIKVNADGEETAWADVLTDLLPFDLTELPPPPEDPEDEPGHGSVPAD